jgi:hypothetical protein
MSILCDFLINVGVLKDHSISQITLTLKNNYGSVNNPGSLHGGQCNPYIPSLNQQIRDVIVPNDKQKIFINDGLIGCYSGGPSGPPNFNAKIILMSFDPVACDTQGQTLINDERANHSLPPYNAPHIYTAAQPPYNLGTTDVNLIEIINPSGVEETESDERRNRIVEISPNPFSKNASITVSLSHPSSVSLNLKDVSGRIVKDIYTGYLASGIHRIAIQIDGELRAGSYFVQFSWYGNEVTEKVTIVK